MDVGTVFPNGLYLSDAAELLWPVGSYVLGMAAYAVFVFKFYRFVAARDMFALDLSRYQESRFRWLRRFLHIVMYVAKYLIVFPAFAAFWFAVLTLILTFLSRDRAITDILLIALATVTTIRATAYYSEDLSRDVAKILPFAVLALFLIDASFFDVGQSLEVLRDADDVRETILYYLLFLVVVEFALRLLLGIVALFTRGKRSASNGSPDEPEEPEDRAPEPTLRERLITEGDGLQLATHRSRPTTLPRQVEQEEKAGGDQSRSLPPPLARASRSDARDRGRSPAFELPSRLLPRHPRHDP